MNKVTMRSVTVLLLLFSALSLSALSVSAAPWIGGYRLSFDGYSGRSPLAEDEHLGIHLWLSPFDFTVADPLISVGVLLPSYANPPGAILEANLELHLLDWVGHPLSRLFRRESAYRPTLAVGALLPLSDLGAVSWALTAHPLSFFFGEKTVSVLAPRLLYEHASERWSWAIRLVEISHSLF